MRAWACFATATMISFILLHNAQPVIVNRLVELFRKTNEMVAPICDGVWDARWMQVASHPPQPNPRRPGRSQLTWTFPPCENRQRNCVVKEVVFYLPHNISRGQMAGLPPSILLGACGYNGQIPTSRKSVHQLNRHTTRSCMWWCGSTVGGKKMRNGLEGRQRKGKGSRHPMWKEAWRLPISHGPAT